MSTDQIIYSDIGSMIFNIAPEGSLKIKFNSRLSPEGDHAIMEYDSIDFNGKTKPFKADGKTSLLLLRKLRELRDFFVSQGQPSWKSMQMTIDVQSGKFEVSFDYD